VSRALVAVLAVLAVAWFAVGVRQAHDTDVATSIITDAAPLSPAQARHAAALLHDAAQLNPDTAVDLLRSHLALRLGEPARARAIALSVTRSEPDNLEAWVAYGSAASHDPAVFTLALRRLNEAGAAGHAPPLTEASGPQAEPIGGATGRRGAVGHGQQQPGQHDGDEGHRRHLPVPVQRGMGDVR